MQFIKTNMETKLNIAEILKDKPKGTKLYSPICGECTYDYVGSMTGNIHVITQEAKALFDCEGKFSPHGECLLFPSDKMRDWSKFAWKKGDVLVSNDNTTEVIFNGWKDDTYTLFRGAYALITHNDGKIEFGSDSLIFETCNYKGIEVEDAAQSYINYIERRLGGKLNLETLEIENTQPEFKDGDILLYKRTDFKHSIFILDTNRNYEMRSYVRFVIGREYIDYDMPVYNLNTNRFRYATEEEKQLLFDALAKENKAWDAEKKQIVDLKIKWTPKTFDRVITRDFDDGVWSANIFSHMNSQGEYVSIGCVEGYAYCLPYNEETAKLIGTTNNAK